MLLFICILFAIIVLVRTQTTSLVIRASCLKIKIHSFIQWNIQEFVCMNSQAPSEISLCQYIYIYIYIYKFFQAVCFLTLNYHNYISINPHLSCMQYSLRSLHYCAVKCSDSPTFWPIVLPKMPIVKTISMAVHRVDLGIGCVNPKYPSWNHLVLQL